MIYQKKIGKVRIPVTYYMLDEAKKMGLNVVHWREAENGISEWLVDDFGLVSKFVHVKVYHDKWGNRNTTYVKAELFRGIKERKNMRINTKLKMETSCGLVDFSESPWWAQYMKRNPWIVDEFMQGVACGRLPLGLGNSKGINTYLKEVWSRHPHFDGLSKQKNVYSLLNRMWYNGGVRKMIKDNFQTMCEKRGLTNDHALDLIQMAEEYAIAKKDGRLLLAIADKIERMNFANTEANKQIYLNAPSDEKLSDIYQKIMKRKNEMEEAVVVAQG